MLFFKILFLFIANTFFSALCCVSWFLSLVVTYYMVHGASHCKENGRKMDASFEEQKWLIPKQKDLEINIGNLICYSCLKGLPWNHFL